MITLVIAIAGFAAVIALALRVSRRGRPRRGAASAPPEPSPAIGAEALEEEDLAQLLAIHNARRLARGQPAQSVREIERELSLEPGDPATRELEQMLEATNARRRSRGLPERTLEEVRGQWGAGG